MSRLNVGDLVRVIPRSYHDLIKSGFNHPSAWHRPDPVRDRDIALGGRYEVLELAPPNGTCVRLLQSVKEQKGWIDESYLWLDQEVDDCPYQAGDRVYFRPTAFDEDSLSLRQRSRYDFRNADKSHVITFVLNRFYIFLDFKPDHPYATPFRWIGFTLGQDPS